MKQYGDLEDEFRLALRIEASRFNEVDGLVSQQLIIIHPYFILVAECVHSRSRVDLDRQKRSE